MQGDVGPRWAARRNQSEHENGLRDRQSWWLVVDDSEQPEYGDRCHLLSLFVDRTINRKYKIRKHTSN